MLSLPYKAVVMGVSAGGLQVLKTIIPALSADFSLPIAIVQHVGEQPESFLAEYLGGISALKVKEAEDKEPFGFGTVYLAPAGYHLLIERDHTFGLSVDMRENYCCPAIDALFESAAEAFGASLIGVVLTGGNADGSRGLRAIKQRGGLAIVQAPETAEAAAMPRAALEAVEADYIVEPAHIAPLLARFDLLSKGERRGPGTGG